MQNHARQKQVKPTWVHAYVLFLSLFMTAMCFLNMLNGAVPQIEAELQINMVDELVQKFGSFGHPEALNFPTRSVYKPVWMGAMTMITMEKEMKFWPLP